VEQGRSSTSFGLPEEDTCSILIAMSATQYVRKPEWLKVQLQSSQAWKDVRASLSGSGLHTVCEEARCPNIHECWGQHKTATFMILGDTCTRRCRFCAVKTGLPGPVDETEPERVALSAASMGLQHVVVTMVNRDDLRDGGAGMLARTVLEIRKQAPAATIEVLSSDLMGRIEDIAVLVKAAPDIVSHNMETVRRLTPMIRSRSTYERSLAFLKTCCELDPAATVKSSIMLGLGETVAEVKELVHDLVANGVQMMNIGQYLQPTKHHVPVQKYWSPEEFAALKAEAEVIGMRFVEAGPLVRSSYHAKGQYDQLRNLNHPLFNDRKATQPS